MDIFKSDHVSGFMCNVWTGTFIDIIACYCVFIGFHVALANSHGEEESCLDFSLYLTLFSV